jgi:hypothetical protein
MSPLDNRVPWFAHEKIFGHLYTKLPRGKLFYTLYDAIDCGELANVPIILKQLINNLDGQLIGVRLARKELFCWDIDLENLGVDMQCVLFLPSMY